MGLHTTRLRSLREKSHQRCHAHDVNVDAIVLTGTTCAGKSTLAAELANRLAGPTGLVELDSIRRFLVGGVPAMSYPPSTDALAQWATAVSICGDIGRRYRDRGWFFIVDAAVYPDDNPYAEFRYQSWQEAMSGIQWQLVVLQPTLAEVERRAASRKVRTGQGPTRRAGMHRTMEKWRTHPGALMIDPTALSVGESADLVLQALRPAS